MMSGWFCQLWEPGLGRGAAAEPGEMTLLRSSQLRESVWLGCGDKREDDWTLKGEKYGPVQTEKPGRGSSRKPLSTNENRPLSRGWGDNTNPTARKKARLQKQKPKAYYCQVWKKGEILVNASRPKKAWLLFSLGLGGGGSNPTRPHL